MNTDELRQRLADTAVLPIMPIASVDAALAEIDEMAADGVLAIEILFRTAEAASAIMVRRDILLPSLMANVIRIAGSQARASATQPYAELQLATMQNRRARNPGINLELGVQRLDRWSGKTQFCGQTSGKVVCVDE